MSAVIQAGELSCFYGLVLGLNNVSFTIGPGITGLVGPNGAGKSTLIKLVTGQLRPSSGRLTVFGEEPWNNPRVLGRIGYCPEHEHVHQELRPADWLRSLAMLSGVPRAEALRRSELALTAVGLSREHWNKRIGTYSKGMRQRVKLAQAILHKPALVILDEPMNGLDPMGRHEIGEILRGLQRGGVHILISSHILDELEALCGGFLMLNWGRVIVGGSQHEAHPNSTSLPGQIVIRTDQPEAVVERLRTSGHLRGYCLENDRVVVWLRQPERFFNEWTELLADCPARIHELQSRTSSLQNAFERTSP
ncbi:MAG: ABC transporter ATP-binding protein [Opitutaceae bacterium]|nr:ABC transporter ATP-binding protein [Opitutaceae bacterium]